MIELNGVCKSYNDQQVLRDVNLSVHPGEIFGIIGRSGTGKSTLLRCINLLERPEVGTVSVNQLALLPLNPAELRVARRNIGMIFQDFNLLNAKTVQENIALPMKIQGMSELKIKSKIEEMLSLVDLLDKRHAYPTQLSGGQKQRVAIARALSCEPILLLCDEATSALDPETTQSILALLQKINTLYGITILLITHQMDVVKRVCHRVAVMESGQIIETTILADVLKQTNSLARGMLYAQLSPKLPGCLQQKISPQQTNHPVLRMLFAGNNATVPFISDTSRALNLDINILLANLDRFNGITCGVLVVALHNSPKPVLEKFLTRCLHANITVEILGYVHDPVF